ncbi:MAG: phospholipid/cholesterol/gamma-HCH transport system substrate-binding protein [Betaproteobacteria bacterium]|jgi:paraquat-inducible protein B|nr:phospholipid/cholesterol/gamma-HCH transport system substrate-binding protein [Betaproteobacteria bacterium]
MKKTSPTLIGVFVLGAAVLAVAAVLFFGSGLFHEKRLRAVSFFNGSVAGLRVGAPVTFRGVPVGEVKSLGVRVMPDGQSIIQIGMELVPGMVAIYGADRGQDADVPALVARGLTAKLVTQSFVTGLLNVELAFRPGAHASGLGDIRALEIPTVPGDLEALTRQLQTVDIAATVDSLQRTLASLNAILTSPSIDQAVRDLPEITAALKHTAATVDREVTALSGTGRAALSGTEAAVKKTLSSVDTLAAHLDTETASTLATLRVTLENANATLDGTRTLLDPQGETVINVQRAIDDLAATAARMRSFAERVDRNPSVLVRGR